jgi:hypothetical protein
VEAAFAPGWDDIRRHGDHHCVADGDDPDCGDSGGAVEFSRRPGDCRGRAGTGSHGNTLSSSASQIEVAVPAGLQDGIASILVADPVSGAFSQMIGALTYGALGTDLLLLLQGAEPATPVGSAAANPVRVRAVATDGIAPVNGATIAWSATNGLQFSVCNGAATCSVLSDAAGESSSWVTPTATGLSTITIALAPESYSPPQSQQATLVGISSTLDLVGAAPTQLDWARRDDRRSTNGRSA